MSYQDIESSVDSGSPVELYEFKRGLQYWRFSSASTVISKDGVDYQTESIRRSDIGQTDDMNKGGIKLTLPITNKFANQFLYNAPESVTTLTVYRGHVTDTSSEYINYWKGRVLSAKASGREIHLECESVFSSMKRAGLRARFELTCRHALYSGQCNVSSDAYRTDAHVTSVNLLVYDVPEASGQPDGYFTGGVIKSDIGDFRFITDHVGTLVTVSRCFSSDMIGKTIALFPGCDKSKSTCMTKFNNLMNYGGFPYIPSKNPFDGRIL